MDHMEVPLNPKPPQAHLVEATGFQFPAQRISRHKGHTEPRHHGLLDRFRVAELHRAADFHASLQERSLGHLPRGRALLTR
jgi:hypothetical protein